MDTQADPTQLLRQRRVSYPSEVALKERNRTESDEGRVKNISVSGMFVTTNRKYILGTTLTVMVPLDLGGRKKLCMIPGKVVRAIPYPPQGIFGYGIKFDQDASKNSREDLTSFVEFKATGKIPESIKARTQRFNPFRD